MTTIRNPILRTLHIPYDLDQFIRVDHVKNNIRYPEALTKYLTIGIDKELSDIREFPTNFYSKSIAIPAEIDDIIVSKSREYNTSYNNIFMEYLILGVKSIDTEDRLLKMWMSNLNNFISELKSIYDINVLQSKLDILLDKKNELEEDLEYTCKNISALTLLIEKYKNKTS